MTDPFNYAHTRLKPGLQGGICVDVKVTNSYCYNAVYTTGGVFFLFGFLLSILPSTDAFPD